MPEEQPIFVTGFSRGGTTILMNLLASHPDVCTVGEIHQVFKGSNILDTPLQILAKAVLRDGPILLSTRQDFLSPRNWNRRPAISQRTEEFIRRVLRHSKNSSQHRHLNRYKSPNVEYQLEEIRSARMLAKNLDGMVFLTDILRSIYPAAGFVGLVRNGLAVCEGHVRRGRKATRVGEMYQAFADRMLNDSQKLANYHVVRFEDFLADPVKQLQQLYIKLNLNPFLVRDVRWQERKMINAEGRHQTSHGEEWDVRWLPLHDLPHNIDPRINARQLAQLTDQDRLAFLRQAGAAMARLGYLGHPPSERRAA